MATNKRKLELEDEGSAKRAATSSNTETVFRLLVPERKVGSLIGKGGSVVRQIRDDTHARIRVVESVPGCEERVVIIHSKDDPSDQPHNSAQRALLAVHARVIEGEEPATVAGVPAPGVPTRLLVCHSQAGSIIGRQGAIIKDMRDTSGAHIKVLPAEDLPLCALANDRVVQLVGTADALRTALEMVSRQMRENPPKERPGGPLPALAAATAAAAPAAAAYGGYAPQQAMFGMQPAPPAGFY